MRLMFVYYAFENQGSGLVIQGYTEAAKELGHEVAVYGRGNPRIPLNYSLDIASADAVIFIFEWTTKLGSADEEYGDQLDLLRLMGKVPRERRVILDGDGNYNDVIRVESDYNHQDAAASRRWIELCNSLSDKICQPTLHPLRGNVRPFLFYAYNPAWAVPFDFSSKDYGMVYVGHSKFRWPVMQHVLRAIGPTRNEVGRIALIGVGWDSLPWWAAPMGIEDTYYSDACYLKDLGVEVLAPIGFEQVIDWMSKGTFNPVLLRPTFNYLKLVTPRIFETLAANTIPIFTMHPTHVQEIYGEEGLELTLPEHGAAEKIADIMRRPQYYAALVEKIRQHLEVKHSHAARLRELLEIVND